MRLGNLMGSLGFTRLHQLAQASNVVQLVHMSLTTRNLFCCRATLSDLAFPGELSLSEDAAGVCLLVEGMYNAHMEITEENVAKLLELSRYVAATIHAHKQLPSHAHLSACSSSQCVL